MTRILLTIFACLIAFPASAGGCYSTSEAEAEQGIRIHSELMVIGLNCQAIGARHGMSTYVDYQRFTQDHATLLRKYEDILLHYFTKNGGGKPEAQLNQLRTDFANKISKDAANLRPDVFCSKYAPRITKASAMRTEDVRKWASTFYPSHPVTKPLCDG